MKQGGRKYNYLRIQGKNVAENTKVAIGVFSLCEKLFDSAAVDDEDRELWLELNNWIAEILPFPPQCQNGDKVVCYFKTENTEEVLHLVNPLLWLLDRYKQPYDVVFTNYPGEIVYEDKYQIVVKAYEPMVEKVVKKFTGKE